MGGREVRRRAEARRGPVRSVFAAVIAVAVASGVCFPAAAKSSTWSVPWPMDHRAVRAPAKAGERPLDPAIAEALLAQADAARTEERWSDAARLFTEAYDALTVPLLVELGEITVRFAVEAHRRVADDTHDDAPLVQARELVDRFEAEIAAEPHSAALPASIVSLREELDASLREAGPAVIAPEVTPPAVPRTATVPSPDRHVRGEIVTWSLVGAGGAVVVAGLVTLVWGSQMLPIARRRLADRGPDNLRPDLDADYLAANRRRGRIVMGVGGGLAVAGLPLLVWGIVRLVRARRASEG